MTPRRKRLTDLQVAALKPKTKRYAVPDPELTAHYVRVFPSGAKSFVVAVRDPTQVTVAASGRRYNKTVWHVVGSTSVLGIEQAREQAREAIRRIKGGKSPVKPPPAKPDSFKAIAEKWLTHHVAKNKLRTEREIIRCLTKYVYPLWEKRDFISIKRSDGAKLLDFIESNHGSRQADVVLGILKSLSHWYETRSDDYRSPLVRGMRRHKVAPRARILDDDELRKVWKQAEQNGSFGAFVRLLLLTGQRKAALRSMKFDQIDDAGVWTIAKQERQKTSAGSLQLPEQAMKIIAAQPRISGNPHVFPPPNSANKVALDAACGVKGWTLHDCRRTARSLMSRAGIRPDISERVLGHVIGGVEGIYDRHRYDTEKADALKRLAALIEEIVDGTPDKIVKLKPKARAHA